jgi:hypothetical protein
VLVTVAMAAMEAIGVETVDPASSIAAKKPSSGIFLILVLIKNLSKGCFMQKS